MLSFANGYENLEHAASLSSEGVAVEFGVYSGTTLSIIRNHHKGPVYGFDSFQGLPETWRPGFEKGHFETATIPVVEGAKIVVGLFEDTVSKTFKKLKKPITLVHFDADLYSSTCFALNEVTPYLADQSVFVFDEYQNYPGWEQHEFLAFKEWQESHPEFSVTAISEVPSHEQVTFVVTKKEENNG